MSSYLRVELRSPKRSLDGGYGFDLTKYCASCWSRLGRILKRGALCGICGRRVCKSCRHFVSSKEWICALCHKKKYAPEDTWHDDANTKQFKRSQGKSGTYLLRLTDWSAHGVLELHKINEFRTGRIHSFSDEPVHTNYHPLKNTLYRKKQNPKPRPHSYPVRPIFNYPLIQHDIQLRNWKTLEDAIMNPQRSSKDHKLKYTSVNLKQRRREMRECKALSIGRGQFVEETATNEFQKRKSYSNRMSSSKREQFESSKASSSSSLHDYDNSSTRRARSGNNQSCTDSSWQREQGRRSRKKLINKFASQPSAAVLHRGDDPHVRLSVRGTRVFGRRKSYRACPTLKGDVRSNGIKCRSSSLPCELSQVESHDYEFWNSGFVQSRVQKLEEELTSKCWDDKYSSYSNDYDIQSLCSLQLDKILPDGDDYRIAYLSSTSQESSLDYMDDNYCTIGMGTLDVKLNKKCVLTQNEDWDLSFSSAEENDSSTDDDDEFFYRRYSNVNKASKIPASNYYSRNITSPNECEDDDDISLGSDSGKRYSDISFDDSLCEPKSVTEQIHENVDRIFYNVLNLDLDVPHSKKQNNDIAGDCFSYSSEDEKHSKYFQEKEEMRQNGSDVFISSNTSDECQKFNNIQNNEQGENMLHLSSNNMTCLNPPDDLLIQKVPGNISADNILSCEMTEVNVFENSVPENFSSIILINMDNLNYSLKDENSFNNMEVQIPCDKNINFVSKCFPFSGNGGNEKENEQMTNGSTTTDFSQCASGNFLPVHDSGNKMPKASGADIHLSERVKGELNNFLLSESVQSRKILNSMDYSFYPEKNLNAANDTRSKIGICDKIQNIDKFSSTESKNLKLCRKFRNSKRLKYKMKRDRWTEDEKSTKVTPQAKSLFEVELIVYEPLSTPFSEIYFITYGEKYSPKQSYKLSIPRRILRDVGYEMMLQFIRKNRVSFTQLLVSNAVICLASQHSPAIKRRPCKKDVRSTKQNSSNNFTGSFVLPNYTNKILTKSDKQSENYEFNQLHLLESKNSHLFLPDFIPKGIKSTLHYRKPHINNYLLITLNDQKIYLQCKFLKDSDFVISGLLGKLAGNINEIRDFLINSNSVLYVKSADMSSVLDNIFNALSSREFNLPLNLISLKSFLLKCFENMKDLSPKSILNYSRTNECFVSVCESVFNFFKILNETNLMNNRSYSVIIDMSQFSIILSSPLLLTTKNELEILREPFVSDLECDDQEKKFLATSCFPEVFDESSHDKFSRLSDFKSDENNSEKDLKLDIFRHSNILSREYSPTTYLPPNIISGNFFAETNHKISTNTNRFAKFKKTNIYFSEKNSAENLAPFLISKEIIEHGLISLIQDIFVPQNFPVHHQQQQQQQMSRNRNYGISHYYEIEITNEVKGAGENTASESRIAVAESQPTTSLTYSVTSPTGNATFVEYLFPPQLASLRDTTKAHLSADSSIQFFQSVPAVQERSVVVDRESRFAEDLEHGSLRAASAANITDSDFYCRAQEDGYPIALNFSETERITTRDHEDYLCVGSVPKGLQPLICKQVSLGDTNWDNFNLACVPSTELPQNMATCDDNPRIINKPTRTTGSNISKLKKLFDSRESVSCSSAISYSKNNDCSTSSSHSTNVNKAKSPPQSVENSKPEIADRLSNGHEENSSLNDLKDSVERETCENTNKPQQRISSDIPYCRKVSTGGDLWKNVDTGLKSSNEGLWNNPQTSDSQDVNTDLRQSSNSFVSSTADLHNLIAASRAELSKKKEPLLSDKSTLENYFTSFENSKPKKCVPLNSTEQSVLIDDDDSIDFPMSTSEKFNTSLVYDCDADEINFEDEDATLSDTSSDEEIRCNPPINTHYLPAYALHTIIEESCEESERDSRNPTPTNEQATSKLERYFSWDIINDSENNIRPKNDDDSTVFSDSLSEGSGSLNDDAGKEIDPSQLASSRLEKYFTSGLVGNDNYFYPDDAEFLEDAPVSDFEEDSIHQKISRSALLSSLESVVEHQATACSKSHELNCNELASVPENSFENDLPVSENISISDSASEMLKTNDEILNTVDVDNVNSNSNNNCDVINSSEVEIEDTEIENRDNTLSTSLYKTPDHNLPVDNLSESEIKSDQPEIIDNVVSVNDDLSHKPTVSKEQLAVDVRAIIKKLLIYFSGTGSNSFKHNRETDYMSAWQILETEIERLIQSISPTASLENNSCNSSTIDSNNSDYGSDTIESLECMTDEDEASDSKSRGNAKFPIVDLFNAAYKIQPGPEFHNFNISDETLSIWKRLIQSLQKDSFCMNDNKLYDPNTEARLYIRDQIVNLMHTVTVSEHKVDGIDESVLNIQDKDIASSLIEENNTTEDINEAFNVSVNSCGILTYSEDNVLTMKKETSDEIISAGSSEITKTSGNILDSESKFFTDSSIDIELNLDQNAKCENLSNSVIDSKDVLPFEAHECQPESSTDCQDVLLDTQLSEISVDDRDVTINSHPSPEKISVDELDHKFNNSTRKSTDNSPNFSLCVNIDLGDNIPTTTEQRTDNLATTENSETTEDSIKRSSLHLWVSGEAEIVEKDNDCSDPVTLPGLSSKDESLYVLDELPDLPPPVEIFSKMSMNDSKTSAKSSRDTGYYSFKSSDDSLLHDTPTPPDAFMDVPNFKSLKRSVKKFPLSNTLSKSTTNINQVLSVSDTKFSTLQLKSHKSKSSSSSANSPSRQFTSLFSPTAVFKKLTGSKGNDTQTTDSSIPAKYLKKYARSNSVESESMIGAVSMPQLNFPKSGDSYSALGLYSENDRDSSLIADDDADPKRYSTYSQSVLSLGAHSVSMTSVYSAAAVTVSGDVLFGLNYNQKAQMMEVFVKQCRNLAAADVRHNRSDPYVKVYLLPDKTKSGKRKTKTKKNALNPVFNELLRFPVLKHELESRTLWLSVWNSDLFGRNDFLGEITLPLGYRLLDSPTLRWYPLQERMESLTSPLNYRGELFLALKYVPRDLSLESRFRPAPVISLRGALHVLVKEARNITANGSGSNLDAFCKSYLLPDKTKSSKQKTPVVKKSRHPKWYYTVIYEDLTIDELKERSLELTVWDHDKITSNEFMGGIRLNLGSGLYHGVSVEWMDSRRDEAALWQAMLQSPNMWVDGCLPLRPTMHFHHG